MRESLSRRRVVHGQAPTRVVSCRPSGRTLCYANPSRMAVFRPPTPLFGNSRADVEWFMDWLQSRPATCRTSWVASGSFFPNDAYDPVWDSEKQVKRIAPSITFSPERTSGLEQRRRRNFALTTTITSASTCRARLAAMPGVEWK